MTQPSTSPRLARTHAHDLSALPPDSSVRLAGWVHRRRELSAVTFLILRDRTGLAQVVIKDGQPVPPEETPVEVTGVVTLNPQAPGGVEITSPQITPLSDAAETPAVELWRPQLDASLPVQLDHAATTWRHPVQRAKWEIAAASLRGFRESLDSTGFTEIHTPKLVESATESGANVFAVDYFGKPAYLAQSPQFYKQVMVGVFERVYEVAPVFRAEPHDTVRHLAEYISLDVELGFIEDHREVIACLREVVAGMMSAIATYAAPAVERLGLTLPEVPAEFPIVHFREALEIAGRALGEDLSAEPDLAPAHERALGEWALAEHGSDFLVVEGYPTAHRAFYSHPDPSDPTYSRSFDLIIRGLEMVSGAQRLHRYDDYVATLESRGYPLAPYRSYIDTFRNGIPPHGGFAIGLERWVARLVEAANIREVTLFPRDLHRLAP